MGKLRTMYHGSGGYGPSQFDTVGPGGWRR
jgi:hypothetical protein